MEIEDAEVVRRNEDEELGRHVAPVPYVEGVLALGALFDFPAVSLILSLVLIASAILSWLMVFNVVNTRNQFVAMVADFLYRVTEPALRPIRRRMPTLGGIDLSPAVLIIGLMFFEQLVYWIYAKAFR